MNRKRVVLGAGGVAAVLVVGTSMLAWSNGAFGTPAVDRVGSFRAIEAQLVPDTKPATTTDAEQSEPSVPRSTRPADVVTTTEPIVRATETLGDSTSAASTTVSPVASSTVPQRHHDDDVERPDGRGNDD